MKKRKVLGIYGRIIRGILWSVLFSLLAVLVLAVVLKFINLENSTISTVNQIIKLVAIALGTSSVALGKERGLPGGTLVGLGYMLLGSTVFILSGGEGFSFPVLLTDLLVGTAAGALLGYVFTFLVRKRQQS